MKKEMYLAAAEWLATQGTNQTTCRALSEVHYSEFLKNEGRGSGGEEYLAIERFEAWFKPEKSGVLWFEEGINPTQEVLKEEWEHRILSLCLMQEIQNESQK